jgi:hypothetical protein
MKIVLVSEFYEINNSNSSLVHSPGDVLAHRNRTGIPVAITLACLTSVPDRRLYHRGCL